MLIKQSRIFIYIILIILLLIRCDYKGKFYEYIQYKMAQVLNSEEKYKEFINNYPQSPYFKLVKKKLEPFDWNRVKNSNTNDKYKKFLIKYPNGKFFNKGFSKLNLKDKINIIPYIANIACIEYNIKGKVKYYDFVYYDLLKNKKIVKSKNELAYDYDKCDLLFEINVYADDQDYLTGSGGFTVTFYNTFISGSIKVFKRGHLLYKLNLDYTLQVDPITKVVKFQMMGRREIINYIHRKVNKLLVKKNNKFS